MSSAGPADGGRADGCAPPRGHGEALSDAWANLYLECAVAIEARRDGRALPDGLLNLPDLDDGARGVDFFHAAADSHEAGGVWVGLWGATIQGPSLRGGRRPTRQSRAAGQAGGAVP